MNAGFNWSNPIQLDKTNEAPKDIVSSPLAHMKDMSVTLAVCEILKELILIEEVRRKTSGATRSEEEEEEIILPRDKTDLMGLREKIDHYKTLELKVDMIVTLQESFIESIDGYTEDDSLTEDFKNFIKEQTNRYIEGLK